MFGLPVEWSTAPLALPAFVLGALAFAPFGVVLVAAVVVWKQATGAAWIMAGITLLAGFYFPVALLPDWIEWTSERAAVHAGGRPPAPPPDRDPAGGTGLADVARMAGFAAVLLPLSAAALESAIKVSRRRGTMLEY